MPVITLTTEYGYRDPAVGIIKGNILRAAPASVIVDITHDIEAYNVTQAAYVLQSAYRHFPGGSIHLTGVDTVRREGGKYLLAKYDGHFFIGYEKALFWLLDSADTALYEIGAGYDGVFPGGELFAGTAAALYKGTPPERLGTALDPYSGWKRNIQSVFSEKKIITTIIHTDRYGNLVTDLHREVFEKYAKGRKYTLFVRSFTINRIGRTYKPGTGAGKVKDGSLVALFNSAGLMEIAIYNANPAMVGGAASLVGLKAGDTVRIEFE